MTTIVGLSGASRWTSVDEAEDHILDHPEAHAHQTTAGVIACANVGGFVQPRLMELHNRPALE